MKGRLVMKKIMARIIFFIVLLLATPNVFADKLAWKLEKHSADFRTMKDEISSLANSGYVPIGISFDSGNIYALYISSSLLQITGWHLEWYKDADTIKAGINNKITQGFLPTGVSYVGDLFYVLYIKSKNKAKAWNLVSSARDPEQNKKAIQSLAQQEYVPVGITAFGNQSWTLMVQLPAMAIKGWSIESYTADNATVRSGIQNKIRSGFVPWGVMCRDNAVHVLYVAFHKGEPPPTKVASRPKKKPAQKPSPAGDSLTAFKNRSKLMEPENLFRTTTEFWEIAKKDPESACALFMTVEAELAFKPVIELTGKGLNLLFNSSVLEMCHQSPEDGMVAFYSPWVDVILITVWGVEDGRPMIYDAELLTGDFLRESGEPPYDVIPYWFRNGKDLPPVAVIKSTRETMKVFREVMSRAVPGHWRLEFTNLKSPDIMVINNFAVAVMFKDRLRAFSAFIQGKSQQPLRDATLDTLEALRAGKVQRVLNEASETPPAAGNILKDYMKGRWDRIDVVGTVGVKNGAFVFVTIPDWPTSFLSFYFKTGGGKADLNRIDVVSFHKPPSK